MLYLMYWFSIKIWASLSFPLKPKEIVSRFLASAISNKATHQWICTDHSRYFRQLSSYFLRSLTPIPLSVPLPDQAYCSAGPLNFPFRPYLSHKLYPPIALFGQNVRRDNIAKSGLGDRRLWRSIFETHSFGEWAGDIPPRRVSKCTKDKALIRTVFIYYADQYWLIII